MYETDFFDLSAMPPNGRFLFQVSASPGNRQILSFVLRELFGSNFYERYGARTKILSKKGAKKIMQNPTRVKLPADKMYKETPLAYCFHLGNEPKHGTPHRFSIPKSQMRDLKIVDGEYDFWIPEWIAKDKAIMKYKTTEHEPKLF